MFSFNQTCDSTVDQKGNLARTLFLLEQYGSDSFISQMQISNNNEISLPVTINPVELIEALSTATTLNSNTQSELIDPRILVKTANKLVWHYTPKATQRLYYSHANKKINAPIMWCNFVFMLQGKQLSVAAVQHKTRPNANTRLYHAPLPNVYQSGKICLGNCTMPDTLDIDALSETYFDSVKTHLNFKGQLRANKETSQSQYYEYIKSKINQPIRVSELTPFGSLQTFIRKG